LFFLSLRSYCFGRRKISNSPPLKHLRIIDKIILINARFFIENNHHDLPRFHAPVLGCSISWTCIMAILRSGFIVRVTGNIVLRASQHYDLPRFRVPLLNSRTCIIITLVRSSLAAAHQHWNCFSTTEHSLQLDSSPASLTSTPAASAPTPALLP
jgi:hypothetical protein